MDVSLCNRYSSAGGTPDQNLFESETLQCPVLIVILQNNNFRRQHFIKQTYQEVPLPFHTGCQKLHNKAACIPVDNQAWQKIALTINKSAGNAFGQKTLSVPQGLGNPSPEKIGIDLLPLPRKQPDSDKGVRINIPYPQKCLFIVADFHYAPQLMPTRTRGQLIGKNPEMAGQYPACTF